MSILIDIDHEAGNLSEYSSTTTDGGDLSAAAAAALAGSDYGLSCVVDDTTNIYGMLDLGTSSTTGTVRARFYLDPNDITIPTGQNFTVFLLDSSSWGQLVEVKLGYASSSYNLRFTGYEDSGSSAANYNITNAPHYIEVLYTKATTVDSNDGVFTAWVDGAQQGTWTDLDNNTLFTNVDILMVGALNVPASVAGACYIDEIIVNDDGGEIGPVVSGVTLTVSDPSHAHAVEAPAVTQKHTLAVDHAAHAQNVDAPAVAQAHALTVADLAHAQECEALALTQAHALTVDDLAHAQDVGAVTVTQAHALAVADADHGHALEDGTAIPSGTLVVTQEGYRWRNDDGSETTATWAAVQDAPITAAAGAVLRLRFVIDATGDPATTPYTLEYKQSTAEEWTAVPAA